MLSLKRRISLHLFLIFLCSTYNVRPNKYFVYIITNQYNTVLYVGITSNLLSRICQHKEKFIKGFTSKYNIDKLVYVEEFNSVEPAIVIEKKIKGWTRKKKELLIESMNPG